MILKFVTLTQGWAKYGPFRFPNTINNTDLHAFNVLGTVQHRSGTASVKRGDSDDPVSESQHSLHADCFPWKREREE
jgi:hypothetical protein